MGLKRSGTPQVTGAFVADVLVREGTIAEVDRAAFAAAFDRGVQKLAGRVGRPTGPGIAAATPTKPGTPVVGSTT